MKVNVVFTRASRHFGAVVVKLMAAVDADNVEDAVARAMEDIKSLLPHDELFRNSNWYWDDDEEVEIEWLESEAALRLPPRPGTMEQRIRQRRKEILIAGDGDTGMSEEEAEATANGETIAEIMEQDGEHLSHTDPELYDWWLGQGG
jgi:hypothetical protein